MRAFVAGCAIALGIAVIAAIASEIVDFRASNVYQSHNGSVRLSER